MAIVAILTGTAGIVVEVGGKQTGLQKNYKTMIIVADEFLAWTLLLSNYQEFE